MTTNLSALCVSRKESGKDKRNHEKIDAEIARTKARIGKD